MTDETEAYFETPCPFCWLGDANLRVITIHKSDHPGMQCDHYAVQCKLCRCQGPIHDEFDRAVVMWNQRGHMYVDEPGPLKKVTQSE